MDGPSRRLSGHFLNLPMDVSWAMVTAAHDILLSPRGMERTNLHKRIRALDLS